MKKIFRKNQIIITTLAIMIAIAGYLNYSGRLLEEEADTVSSNDNTVLLTDENAEDTYVDTYTDIVTLDDDGIEAASGEDSVSAESSSEAAVGEAVLASTSVSSASNVLASAKLNREQVRAKSKEELQEVIDNSDITEDLKQNAVEALTALTLNAEKESAAELLLEASGYTDCVVSITDDMVDVVVSEAELTEAQRAQIEDIVKRKTEVAGQNIVITPAAAVSASESVSDDGEAENTEEAENGTYTE